MATKKAAVKRGRKPLKKESDRIRVRPVYITSVQEKKIVDKYGTLTKALKIKVLEEY